MPELKISNKFYLDEGGILGNMANIPINRTLGLRLYKTIVVTLVLPCFKKVHSINILCANKSSTWMILSNNQWGMIGMKKASTGMVCYACKNKLARPRDIGGTRYYLCDQCFNQHIWANFKALEYLKTKRDSSSGKNMKGHRKDSSSGINADALLE
ncbi:MAG: hypothetical protein RQM95_00005 [Syntrophaceticus schinkii]